MNANIADPERVHYHCGMLLLFLAVSAAVWPGLTGNVFDLTGMRPQIAELRTIASANHLRIQCMGKEGEARVIQLALPNDLAQTDRTALLVQFEGVASQVRSVDRVEAKSGRCDHVPNEGYLEPGAPFGDASLEPATHDLGIGPADRAKGLLGLAIACGYAKASVREMTQIDRRYFGKAINHPKIEPDWLVLDAGEKLDLRVQPAMCFLKMSHFKKRSIISTLLTFGNRLNLSPYEQTGSR